MGIYNDFIIPHLIAVVMQNPISAGKRSGVVGAATGTVLEIGIGSGLNLPFYSNAVERVLAVEPSEILRKKASAKATELGIRLQMVGHDAQQMDIKANSVDTAVVTWALCSIPEPEKAISEIRRVLKPNAKLLFIEHGLADSPRAARWQNRLNPLWHYCAGGCNMNRQPENLLLEGGFTFDNLEKGFVDGPSLLSFEYKGVARPGK